MRSFGNLWRALIPLVALVAFVVVMTWPRSQGGGGIHVVDTVAPITAARQVAGFAMPAPEGLPQAWRATSTEYQAAGPDSGVTFRIGYVTPSGAYAEFLVSNDAAPAVTARYGELTSDGTTSIRVSDWSKYVTAKKNRTLLSRTEAHVTVVVTGSAPEAELTELAASVRLPDGSAF